MSHPNDLKQWSRGVLMLIAAAGCQSGDTDETPIVDPDVSEALSALPDARVLAYASDGVPEYVVGALGAVSAAHAAADPAGDAPLRSALGPVLKVFRLTTEDLVLRKVNLDEQGARHYRYAQRHQGLEVIGGDLVVHVDAAGEITGANGSARGGAAPAPGEVALAYGAADAGIASDARWADLGARRIGGGRMVYVLEGGALRRAYERVVSGQRGADPVSDKVYVDADTGAVLAVHPQIHFARNRNTYNLNGGTSLPGTLARTEAGAAVSDVDVNAAHDGAGYTYDMYKFFWNRDSYNNAGAELRSSVHYSTNYCNAFWNNVQMVYGDGNASQNCLPLARSIDVAAHEMTHAVTSAESNLTYSGESGGLNESLSDVWGAGVEAWVDGGRNGTLSLANDVFLIGDTVLPPFLRSMCDPAADGASRDEWTSTIGSADVHYSSGPNNLVFCLLSKGGTHPRGKTTIPVPAIGMKKTLDLMYKANVDILTSGSNYASMRAAMLTAAQQLGFSTAEQDAVGCAYAAIKVGAAPASCGGTPPPADPALTSGVPVTGISDATGGFKFWRLTVPAGQASVTFTIAGGTGDADLYVNFGARPSTTVYQCRPYLSGNGETCTFTPPSAGTYYVGIHAYAAYAGVTLTGTIGAPSGDPYLANGTPVNGVSGAASSAQYWRIAVPAGKTLSLRISGGTGDADLYTRFGARPTTTTYSCRPYLSGSTEACTHSGAQVGDWYVMVRGFTAFSGVQLIGSY